jgi:hypothetical protein
MREYRVPGRKARTVLSRLSIIAAETDAVSALKVAGMIP